MSACARNQADIERPSRPGETIYRPFVISVLGIDGSHLAHITAFEAAHLITAFGLPASL